MIPEEDKRVCEECGKRELSTRFEGLTESNICDNCLKQFKEKGYI